MMSDIPPLCSLPDHLLIEIIIRLPVSDWPTLSRVNKQLAHLFRQDLFWTAALRTTFPLSLHVNPWPGPIPQAFTKRRYTALYVSKHIFSLGENLDDEVVGHVYLFLKDQLQISNMPPLSAVLHGTIIDQFIACGKSRDTAHELASTIWLAVVDNLEENEHTFNLLKRLASEGDVILPFPYSRSYEVQGRVFERLFTDFRDCLNHVEYCDLLASAKQNFQSVPSAWLGY